MTVGSQLAPSLRYAIGTVEPVTPGLLPAPTPCRAWDLGMLLAHLCDSVTAIAEGITGGEVCLDAAAGVPADPRSAFLAQAGLLLARCEGTTGGGTILVGGCPMAADMLTAIGAVEIAVHGWDVSQACGARQPIPEPLAAALLPVARALMCDNERTLLFGPPRPAGAAASASDQLAAFLGRTPAPLLIPGWF